MKRSSGGISPASRDVGEVERALEAFCLQDARLDSAGGTAGKAWRVTAAEGTFFMRKRGGRTATPQRIRYDHGLRRHLAERGFCAFPPVETAEGESFVGIEGSAYELYPWVEGGPLEPEIQDRVRPRAAAALAKLHALAADYEAPCEPTLPQFGHYPVAMPVGGRFDDPDVLVKVVEYLSDQYGVSERRKDLALAVERVRRWRESYADLYRKLPVTVIHGDYNACNLLYRPDGEVAGVFDFDWAWRDTRVRDIAEGIIFFGARRTRRIDSGSIWELTACPEFDGRAMAEFVQAYHAVNPLDSSERRALVPALLGCWVAFRTEGIMKVPEERGAEFFLQDFFRPFEWAENFGAEWTRWIESVN